jgi:succinate dehydrogenase/fumarate reductase flavoprotein subunit
VAGAISGGGNVNSAWALSSGRFAGQAAARLARQRPAGSAPLVPLGEAGLRPRGSRKAVDAAAARQVVKAEMQPLDKGLFRTARGLCASRHALDEAWREIADHAAGSLALREAAALLATARWSVASALRRSESRGLHRRADAPAADPRLALRLLSGGFDSVWVAEDGPRSDVHPTQALEAVP